MNFRHSRADDFDGILRLYSQLHPADQLDATEARTAFEIIIEHPGVDLLVLEEAGVIVGTSYLNVIPNMTRGARPYAVIENVVIDEAHRGTGRGRKLLKDTLALAWEANCYKAMLMTGSKRERTLNFYRSAGFSSDEKTAFLARPS